MMPIRRDACALLTSLICIVALPLAAQEIRMGGLEGNSSTFTASSTTVLIDWSRPATTTGTVNTASVAWIHATAPCDNIFYVRFYAIPSNSFVALMTTERGPFRAVNGINTVALDPPVSVQPDMFIGIRRAAGPDSCGQPYGTFTRQAGRAFSTNDDFKFGNISTLQPLANYTLQAQASNVPSVRVATIPIVGAAPGNFGAFFRSALTLSNPTSLEIRGKLLFHPNAQAGASTDPTMDYTIPANGSIDYPDIVTTAGLSGIYSLDILTTGSPTPLASARVFNDAGDKGTNGLTEDAVPALSNYSSTANVLIPTDLTNYRLNIGVRTITSGDLSVVVYDAAGNPTAGFTKTYAANYFEQVAAAAFLNGNTVPPGGRIVVSAFQKEFMVYGSVTDNRTNDPNMRIGSD